MPREIHWGTPGRSPHYLRPRGKWAFFTPALVIGGAVLFFVLLLHLVGFRGPVSPGSVISQHAPVESRCDECHTPRHAVANLRCQRCHDPSTAGRLANSAHVLWGSNSLEKAERAPDLRCASCHIEHRGRTAKLAQVNELQCSQCHFTTFLMHPEFSTLRGSYQHTPGVFFGHEKHLKEVMKQLSLTSPVKTCVACHQVPTGKRDFQPISFDLHCASCHGKNGQLSVGTDPIPAKDALTRDQIAQMGKVPWLPPAQEFDVSGGAVVKTVVRHRDEWVLYNLGRLRREIDPSGWAAERARLVSRLNELQRRLSLALPLANLDLKSLEDRERAIVAEISGLDARIKAQADAVDPSAGLDRLKEILAAADASGDPEASSQAKKAQDRARALKAKGAAPAPLPAEDRETRRAELLRLLDAIDEADPGLKWKTQDLRRRLQGLTFGTVDVEELSRVRQQRLGQLQKVRDEIELRRSGIPPPSESLLDQEAAAIRAEIQKTQILIDRLQEGPPPRGNLQPADVDREKESVKALAAACLKCHDVTVGAVPPVNASGAVLVRATFVHEPHLLPVQGDCFHCHPSIQQSRKSSDLNFKGIQSCRECHKPLGVREGCETCHRYHPPPFR